MEERTHTAIVVVPFPAQSHLNQLLHFSLVLSSRGLPVHYACSATHNRQVKLRSRGWDPNAIRNIHFHDLPLAPFPSPLPNPDPVVKFPAHLQPMFDASDLLEGPVSELLCSVTATCNRLILVYDPLMSFAGHEAVAAVPNAEVFRFHCIPAFAQLGEINREWTSKELDVVLCPLDGVMTDEFAEFISRRGKDNPLESGAILNSCRAVENEFIDLLSQQPSYRNKMLFTVGPLIPSSPTKGQTRHECLDWLDKQPPASVVYVSFGTTTSIPDEQIHQLAVTLRQCGHRFLWVLREADLSDIFLDAPQKKLPQGFEEDTKGMGMVVRDWAPQLDILSHPSTGAFVSHCGWNSCMESLAAGVPIVAWPMHCDQPRNALMVTEYLKAGAAVRDWSRHGEMASAAEIGGTIRRVMERDEGKEMRKRAQALGAAIRSATSEGGTSRGDLDSFVTHITRS